MTPDKTWHGYWVNGGDAGFGLSVEWNAPEGVRIAPFRYPVPDALILFGMMDHVYEHPYALLAEVRVDDSVAPGTDLTLSGIANWLACTDKVCVPERSEEHTSDLQSLMRISYAVFCLQKKTKHKYYPVTTDTYT